MNELDHSSAHHRPLWLGVAVLVGFLAGTGPAFGLPAFARKYKTSCLTCHVVYPKLNPFGEAFRRNGYRFPGVDSDAVQEETVPLGQEAYKKLFPNAVWPSLLPAHAPFALGFNGQAVLHPDSESGGALADNGARVNLDDLVEEGHLWAGGSFDDSITFYGEVTIAQDATELEIAKVLFNDLVGPKHAVNLVVGKLYPTLSTYGLHSSYVGDAGMTSLSTTALYGATSDSWNTLGNYNGVELEGTLGGRFAYALGVNAGANVDVENPNNEYLQVGYKLGGLRLDGEGASGPADVMKPWSETALTLNGFYYRSKSRFTAADESVWNDGASTWGAEVRGQLRSLEVNVGSYREDHDHALVDGTGVRGTVAYAEVSYVVYPWLVPALRVEHLSLRPDTGPDVSDTRYVAGAAFLVRANLKLVLSAWVESAKGAPPGGWGPAGGMAVPATPTASVSGEVETITLGMAYAF